MSAFVVLLSVATATPVLDKSIVVLPEQAGIFVHDRSRVGTPDVRDGVDADYEVPGLPGDPWIRVMIVPNGRVDMSAAEQVLALERTRSHPAFVNLQVLPAAPITVDAPARGSLHPAAGTGTTRAVTIGSRQSFTYMDRDGQQTRDAGLVFHRQLADITVRVRVAADDMSQPDFDALADRAAREIVPLIDIRNVGNCPEPVHETNCVPRGSRAADTTPIIGVQHTLVYPLVPAPSGCRRDGVVLASCD